MDALLSAHSPSPSVSSPGKKNKPFPPLSNHGMPKPPMPISPGGSIRPHRFSGRIPSSPTPSSQPPMSPMSPPMSLPMSPPMSAKSFGTFIDSEPSTPAYSPRMGSTWDSSTLVLLSPVSSAPSSHASVAEPPWEMMVPIQKPVQKPRKSLYKSKAPAPLQKEIIAETSLTSHPVKPFQDESHKENVPAAAEQEPEPEPEPKAEQPTHTAVLEKLSNRVKSILRRRNLSDANKSEDKKRRRKYHDLDRIEDVHWTEM